LLKTIRIDNLKNKNSFLFPKPTYKCLRRSIDHLDTTSWKNNIFPAIKTNRTIHDSAHDLKKSQLLTMLAKNNLVVKSNREVNGYLRKIKKFVS